MCCTLLQCSEVNGIVVPDMDAFLLHVHALADGDFVRLKITHLETMQDKVRRRGAALCWAVLHCTVLHCTVI